MVTVQQGKQIASIINGYDVYGMFADRALREDNKEEYTRWANNRDLAMAVLSKKFNINLPNAQRALIDLETQWGAEKLTRRIEREYEDTVDFCKKA